MDCTIAVEKVYTQVHNSRWPTSSLLLGVLIIETMKIRNTA